MCVRELNFRLLLRGLRADSLFAYRSKSSRVSVPLMRMLYPMGHYGSTGFGVERFGTYLYWQARVFQKPWFIFNGLIPRSCSTLPLLSFHLAAVRLELDPQFEIQSLLIPLYFVVLLFRRALFSLDGAISGPVVLPSRFHRLLSPGVGLT